MSLELEMEGEGSSTAGFGKSINFIFLRDILLLGNDYRESLSLSQEPWITIFSFKGNLEARIPTVLKILSKGISWVNGEEECFIVQQEGHLPYLSYLRDLIGGDTGGDFVNGWFSSFELLLLELPAPCPHCWCQVSGLKSQDYIWLLPWPAPGESWSQAPRLKISAQWGEY